MIPVTEYAGLGWLVNFLIHSSIVLGGLWLVDLLRRRAARPLPEIVWRLGLIAALAAALPAATRFGTRIDIEAAPLAALRRETSSLFADTVPAPAADRAALAEGDARGVTDPSSTTTAPADTMTPRASTTSGASTALPAGTWSDAPLGYLVTSTSDLRDGAVPLAARLRFELSWLQGLGALWAAIAAALLARLALDYARASREFGPRRPLASDHDAHAVLRALCAQARVSATPKLTTSETLHSPVSLIGNEICIPDWTLADLDREQLRGLLAHELAHQTRGDPLLFAFLQVIERVFFFQPLFRLAHARLRVSAELAADDWAKAHTRNGRAIATTLYACVARSMGHDASFGIAIVTEPSILRRRTQRLLASQVAEQRPPGRTATAMLVCATFAVALALPTFRMAQAHEDDEIPVAPAAPAPSVSPTPAPAAVDPATRVQSVPSKPSTPARPSAPAAPSVPAAPSSPGVHMRLHEHNEQGDFEFEVGDTTLKATWRGDLELDENETDVVDMDRNGYFELEKRTGRESHRMVFEERDGAIARTWYVGGKEQPLDEAARAWLAATLPEFMRASGSHAEERVDRFLEKGGPDAVLDEMDLMAGSYPARRYAELLVAKSDLSEAELRRVLDRIAKIEGDYDLRTALSAILEKERLSPAQVGSVLAIGKGIRGSYDRRTLLESVAGRPLTAPLLEAYVELAAGIESAYDLRVAIVAALENPSVEGPGAAKLLDLAGRSLNADYDLGQVVQSAPQVGTSNEATAAAIRALEAIGSSYDRRVSLVHIVENATIDEENWLAIIAAAAKIEADYDCAEALSSIAVTMPLDDATKAAYREAAASIGSEYDRTRAQEALGERGA
jgi:beta-lactamase regulating signal transducer with metallopeptidase domain